MVVVVVAVVLVVVVVVVMGLFLLLMRAPLGFLSICKTNQEWCCRNGGCDSRGPHIVSYL